MMHEYIELGSHDDVQHTLSTIECHSRDDVGLLRAPTSSSVACLDVSYILHNECGLGEMH